MCDHAPILGRIFVELDIHHITDRKEMPNGGYVPENGIALCRDGFGMDCHAKAELGFQKYMPSDLYRIIRSSKEKATAADTETR
jgi:hypothetical protein